MQRFFFGAAVLAGLLIGLFTLPASAQQATDSRWVSLFNGTDLTGWKIPDKSTGSIEEVIRVERAGKVVGYDARVKSGKTFHLWRVENGMLIGGGLPSHLFSERGDYADFKFSVEAMINDRGNSGQYFRSEFGPGFPRGYEAQICTGAADRFKTGSLIWSLTDGQTSKDAGHRPGEFFVQEVTCIGDTITISVNGKKTVDGWRDAQQRFKRGHLALQVHDRDTVVTFKKIEVRELSAGGQVARVSGTSPPKPPPTPATDTPAALAKQTSVSCSSAIACPLACRRPSQRLSAATRDDR